MSMDYKKREELMRVLDLKYQLFEAKEADSLDSVFFNIRGQINDAHDNKVACDFRQQLLETCARFVGSVSVKMRQRLHLLSPEYYGGKARLAKFQRDMSEHYMCKLYDMQKDVSEDNYQDMNRLVQFVRNGHLDSLSKIDNQRELMEQGDNTWYSHCIDIAGKHSLLLNGFINTKVKEMNEGIGIRKEECITKSKADDKKGQ